MHLCVYTRACDGVCLNYFAIYCATETSYVKNMRTGDGGCRSERETEMRLQQLLCCFFFLASHWLTSSSRTYCVRRRNARGRPLWHHIALLLALNEFALFSRLLVVYSSSIRHKMSSRASYSGVSFRKICICTRYRRLHFVAKKAHAKSEQKESTYGGRFSNSL